MIAESCIAAIKKALGGNAKDEDVEAIAENLQRRTERMRREYPDLDPFEAAMRAARALGDEARHAAIVEKRNALLNAMRRDRRFQRYDEKPGQEDAVVSELNVGATNGREDGVDGQFLGLRSFYFGGLKVALDRAGFTEVLAKKSQPLERKIVRELWRLTDSSAVSSGDSVAAGIAKVIRVWQEKARLDLNRAGAWIGELAGWVVRQSHDPAKLLTAGFENWKAKILPLLDEKTFEDVKDRDLFLKHVWTNLATGNHAVPQKGGSAFPGTPASLARKASEERILHFKDADSWFDYNEVFGVGSLMDSVEAGLAQSAQRTAIMRVWGPNPEAAFADDLRRLQLRAKENGDFKALERLSRKKLQTEFKWAIGEADRGGSPNLAKIGMWTRLYEMVTRLGGTIFSQVTDIPTAARAARFNGVNYLEAMGNQMTALVGQGKASREIADLLATGADAMRADIAHRFLGGTPFSGKVGGLVDTYFKLNLMRWWTRSQKMGFSTMLSRNMAKRTREAFSALDRETQFNLSRYGIGEKEWALFGRMEKRAANGREYLTPDAIDDLGDDLIAEYAGKSSAEAIERAREDLRIKLHTFFAVETENAFSAPRARHRAFMYGDNPSGTYMGEALRLFWQLKSFGVSYFDNHVRREFGRKMDPATRAMGIFHLAVVMTGYGYIAMTGKDLAKGRLPRDPTDPKTWGAAALQAGGLGILGDFLFGKESRFGQGLAETLGGPAISDLSSLVTTAWKAGRGDFEAAGDDLMQFGFSRNPANAVLNLFYVKLLADYGFLWALQEQMNPGYLARTRRRIERENKQQFWLAPTSAVRWGD